MTETILSVTDFSTSTTEYFIDNITVWSNVTERPPLFPPRIPPGLKPPLTVEAWLVPLVLSIVTLIGVVGNSVVIFVVFKNGKMHTVTNFYIVNLAVTDISFLIFVVPPTASTYATPSGSWIWGSFLCKFVNYMQMASIYIYLWIMAIEETSPIGFTFHHALTQWNVKHIATFVALNSDEP